MYGNLRTGGSPRGTTRPYESSKNADSYSAKIRASGSRGESQEGLSPSASASKGGAPDDTYELHQMNGDRIRVERTVEVV